MALDKRVDSAQLDAALTYEAGKIRAKLGSSAQISFDLANQKGFGDVIDAIPSGGGNEYGIKDVSYLSTSGEKDITVSNNAFLNATVKSGTYLYFGLKKPIALSSGDVLELDVKKTDGSLNWSRIGLFCEPIGNIEINSNFNFYTNKQTFTYTVTDSVVDGLAVTATMFMLNTRNGAWSNGSFVVELRLNGTVLFSSF